MGDVPLRPLLRLPFRFFVELAKGQTSTRRLACAICLGMAIGLLPKLNLIALGLMLFAVCMPVNLAIVTVTAIVFTFVGTIFGAVTNDLGQWLLSLPQVNQSIHSLFDQRMGAWTSLDDARVIGNLTLAIVLVVPVFVASCMILTRHRDAIESYLKDFWIYRTFLRPPAPSESNVSGAVE